MVEVDEGVAVLLPVERPPGPHMNAPGILVGHVVEEPGVPRELVNHVNVVVSGDRLGDEFAGRDVCELLF